MTILVGVTGKARSGKDTVGQAFAEFGLVRLAFADALKDASARLLAIPRADFDSKNKNNEMFKFGVSIREFLQIVGTDFFRSRWPHFWIESVISSMVAHVREYGDRDHLCKGFCITDVRFENEANWIRKSGGILFHVIRSDAQELSEAEKNHSSEFGIVVHPDDKIIHNRTTIKELKETVRQEWKSVCKRQQPYFYSRIQ